MSNKNPFLAEAILYAIFRASAYGDDYMVRPISPPASNLYFALHTSDPDPGNWDDQEQNECSYGAYARVALDVSASNTDTSISGNTVTLDVDKEFPRATSGSEVATHWSLGMEASGSSIPIYYGPLPFPVNISSGVKPIIKAGTTITET
jgi:hypothetical protein